MTDIVSEESSVLGESNMWSRSFSTCSTTLNWMISLAKFVTRCLGFAPLQRNVRPAPLDKCASTSSGLCRHTVSLTLPDTSLHVVRLTPCQRVELLTGSSTIKPVVGFCQDLDSFAESHATQMDEDQYCVAWSVIIWNGGTPPRSRFGVACQGIGKIVKQRADLIGRRNIWIDMMRLWKILRVPPFDQNSHT